MQRPNFSDQKKLIKAINDMNSAFAQAYADRQRQEENIKAICRYIAAQKAKKDLESISTEELKNAKSGIRVQALQNAGYTDLFKIANATDIELMAIEGIGEKQVEAIHSIVTQFANSLSSRVAITIDVKELQESAKVNQNQNGAGRQNDTLDLVTELFRYKGCELVRRQAFDAAGQLNTFAGRIRDTKIIGNSVHWLFSMNETKQRTLMIMDEIHGFYDSELFMGLVRFLDAYNAAAGVTPDQAIEDFTKNSAGYYALLEAVGNVTGNKPFLYDSIPARLAEEVESEELNLTSFSGNLRAYQLFGTKYIIHQERVLLGDEMGLGKTIQAIAAMSHINAVEKNAYFLVICPASVIVNWAREIRKFTSGENTVKTFVLHGQTIEASFGEWRKNGGAAITNYESMGKIVDKIDNHMELSLLVVDEAHYMKNPDAQRTMHIRRLDNESKRIVMMTGTPLENRVEEMCNLIDFVRPDMTNEVRANANISSLAGFREKLSPVYIRRTRAQVLTELPPIDEKQEWCEMTSVDRDAYINAVMNGSFPDIRRVSYLQDNLENSAKLIRLRELCSEAGDEGRKVVVFSFFRETLAKVSAVLGDKCIGVISGDTKVDQRQPLVDQFADSPDGSVLVCQIQAGGVGLNIQSASIVIFCEPQIKPSLTNQALSRVYRMGQVRNVLVYHLLCPDTVDEHMINILEAKQKEFDNFADKSAVAGAYENIMDNDWINRVIEEEIKKYNGGAGN